MGNRHEPWNPCNLLVFLIPFGGCSINSPWVRNLIRSPFATLAGRVSVLGNNKWFQADFAPIMERRW